MNYPQWPQPTPTPRNRKLDAIYVGSIVALAVTLFGGTLITTRLQQRETRREQRRFVRELRQAVSVRDMARIQALTGVVDAFDQEEAHRARGHVALWQAESCPNTGERCVGSLLAEATGVAGADEIARIRQRCSARLLEEFNASANAAAPALGSYRVTAYAQLAQSSACLAALTGRETEPSRAEIQSQLTTAQQAIAPIDPPPPVFVPPSGGYVGGGGRGSGRCRDSRGRFTRCN